MVGIRRGDLGDGPECPEAVGHGRLYHQGKRLWCPVSQAIFAVGEDGHSAGPVVREGYSSTAVAAPGGPKEEPEEKLKGDDEEVSETYERAVRDIAAGRTTIDQAVKDIARSTRRSSTQVRESLNIMTETVNDQDREEDAPPPPPKPRRVAPRPAPAPNRKLEHVDAAQFLAAMAEYGLTAKQAAEATGEAQENIGKKMGSSPTYIYIICHDGASVVLFEKFKAAIRAYAKRHKIRRAS